MYKEIIICLHLFAVLRYTTKRFKSFMAYASSRRERERNCCINFMLQTKCIQLSSQTCFIHRNTRKAGCLFSSHATKLN